MAAGRIAAPVALSAVKSNLTIWFCSVPEYVRRSLHGDILLSDACAGRPCVQTEARGVPVRWKWGFTGICAL